MGIVRYQLGRLSEAVDYLDRAIRRNPDFAEAHNNRGIALKGLGRLEEAVESYGRALGLKPNDAKAHNNLGNALAELGRPEAAIASYREALALAPTDGEVASNLGAALQDQGRFEEAISSFERALALRPNDAEILNNLATALAAAGRRDDAIDRYRQALALAPGAAMVHYNLGNALAETARWDEAVASYDRALAAAPEHVDTHNNLGNALRNLGRNEEALASFRRVLELDPANAGAFSMVAQIERAICDWSNFRETREALIRRVREGGSVVGPFTFAITSDDPADQLRCAREYRAQILASAPAATEVRVDRQDARIRLAYVSADFREHAVARLLVELIERHDRDRFEVVGVSIGPDDGSAMRRRLEAGFDRFIDAGTQSDNEIAALIAAERSHIAVDLNGYTKHCRPDIFAHRPAPIQVNYLGYPGTMGAEFIDYVVTDPFIAPASAEADFSERLVRLPDCYQPNDGQRPIAETTPSRAEAGLPEQGFVFCSFNNSFKITPDLFEIWMRLLRQMPESVLWLLGDSEATERNLRREAAAREIEPARLLFAPRVPQAEHLARHRLADLFLDTLPYNAHTTASDALWAGLPVLSCAGRSFQARVAGSLLHAVGLPELVVNNLADYEALALRLARDGERLAALGAKLARNRSTAALFDCRRYCRHLEAAYREMFDTWHRGEAPKAIRVAPA